MQLLPLPLLAIIATAPFAHALDASAWRFTQPVEAPAGRLVALELPDATLDAARGDLADIRITDAAGTEVSYLLDRTRFTDARETSRLISAKNFVTTLDGNTTRIVLETGTTDPVAGVALTTPGTGFLKAVRVEGSPDGATWTTLAEGLPIFRQKNGAENLRVAFPAGVHARLRITVDDAREDPVPFTGATLRSITKTTSSDPRVAVPVTIKNRVERDGVTRLTLDLGAANLPLSGITLETPEALFTRRVTASFEQPGDNGIETRTVTRDSLWNISGIGGEPSSQKRLAFETQIPGRELIVSIDNGDSPPLAITGISADRRPRRLIFITPTGPLKLLSGNTEVPAPRYDLGLLAEKIGTGGTAPAAAGFLTPNPGYKAFVPKPLPGIAGAPIDTASWRAKKQVGISAPGAQQLELDLETLCLARADLGDLRLVSGGTQVPYLIERTGTTRKHPVGNTALPPAKTAGITRYRIELPAGSPPVVAVDFQSGATGGFVRRVRLLRETTTTRDGLRTEELATSVWRGDTSPDARDHTCVIPLRETIAPAGDKPGDAALTLEIDNGSDAPITPFDFRIHTPAVKLLFIAPASGALSLHFANPAAVAPHYSDIRIATPGLAGASKATATLGPAEINPSTDSGAKRNAGLILWISLTALVVGLLFVVTKMLPKPHPPAR